MFVCKQMSRIHTRRRMLFCASALFSPLHSEYKLRSRIENGFNAFTNHIFAHIMEIVILFFSILFSFIFSLDM